MVCPMDRDTDPPAGIVTESALRAEARDSETEPTTALPVVDRAAIRSAADEKPLSDAAMLSRYRITF